MSRILSVIIALFSVLTVYADTGKYDELLQKTTGLSDEQIIKMADRCMSRHSVDDAMVLYMVVASRPSNNLTDTQVSSRVKANLKAGDVHYSKGNYSNALRYYVTGLKLSEKSDKHPYLAVLYKNMGNVYNMFQDFEKGQSLYMSGLKEARRVRDNETAYKLLQNLVGVCLNLGNVKAARRYYEQSMATPHKVTEESEYMDHYIPALLLKQEGKLNQSVLKFRELLARADRENLDARYKCSVSGEIGRIYLENGQQDSAVYYLSRVKDIAQANSILYQYTESLKLLYSLLDECGEYAKASELKNRYLELKDSIYNQRQFDMAKNQQFLYEMEKTEKAIAELNDKQTRSALLISRQRIVLWSVVGAVALALLLLYYFYRQKKKLGQSYRNLYEIHRRMVADHKEYREKQTALIRENEELQAALDRLSGQSVQSCSEGVSHDEVILAVHPVADDPKYERSALTQLQRDRLANDISKVMESQQPFCSSDFSLTTLAALVDSNSKYVSQVINDVFKKNFSTFVNEYRVNLACERLTDQANFGHYSMNGIGDSVGFKTGATFTTVFKKMTGITPSVYQKMSRQRLSSRVSQSFVELGE